MATEKVSKEEIKQIKVEAGDYALLDCLKGYLIIIKVPKLKKYRAENFVSGEGKYYQ